MEKAFDRIKSENVRSILEQSKVEKDLFQCVQSLYEKTNIYVRSINEGSHTF